MIDTMYTIDITVVRRLYFSVNSDPNACFIVFRFFDMVKPPPIGYFDRRLKGGFGIMFDDLVAAFFTLLVIALWRMSV